jgi:hypothetical protein
VHHHGEVVTRNNETGLFESGNRNEYNLNNLTRHFLKEALGEKCPTTFELIKIDTQGSDFKILESCLPLIKPSSTILIEYSPFHLYLNGTSKEQIERILDRFKIIKILHHPNTVESTNKNKILDDFDNLKNNKVQYYYELILSELQHV